MRRWALLVLICGGTCAVWLVGSPWGDGESGIPSDSAGAGSEAGLLRTSESADPVPAPPPPATLRGAPPADRPLAEDEGGLYGVVLDAETGAPVPGVTVHALRLDWYHGKFVLMASAVSDAAGRYRLRGLGKSWEDTGLVGLGNGWASDIVAENSDSGFDTVPTSLCFEVAEGEWIPLDVRVRPAMHVSGTVLRPDGSPASRASVRLDQIPGESYFPWDVLPPTSCDDQGRFGLAAQPGQMLTAHHDGYVDAVAEVSSTGGTLHLRFEAPHRAMVHVVDSASGSDVEEAEVCFEWSRLGSTYDEGTLVRVQTSPDGVATLDPVPADGFQVCVRKEGYLTFGYGKANRYGDVAEETTPGHWTATVDLVALKTIEGRVEWPAGGELPKIAFLRSEGETRHLNARFRGHADVDPDGTFRIQVPPDGMHRLSFFANDHGDRWRATADVEAAATEVVLRPVLMKVREVVDRSDWGLWELTLRDPQGRPLASAAIDREGPVRSEVSPCDPAEGLDAGRVEVRVAPGSESAWLLVRFARTVDGEALGSLLVGPLGPEGGARDVVFPEARTVTGRVEAPDGTPLQGVEVWATPVTSIDDPYWHDDGALTDADGRFVLRDLLQPTYEIAVRPTGSWVLPATQRVDAGAAGLVFRLVSPTTCAITVRDAAERALEDAFVILWQRDGVAGADENDEGIHLWTDAEGRVEVTGLEPRGVYDLRIEPPRGRLDLLSHIARAWTPRDEIVVLSDGLRVKGVVRDAAGRPMPRVEVWLEHPGGRRVTRLSDGIGRFAFSGVAPGDVRLAACFPEAHEEDWAPVLDVAALAGDVDLELRLDSARDLHVRVRIPEGETPGMKTIDLTPAEDGVPGPRKRVAISEHGAALFRGLEPGRRYRLWGGPTKTGRYVLAEIDAEQSSVLASLAEGGRIEGRLLLPPGAAQTGVKIVKRGIHCHAKPLPRGEFRLEGVPAGAWTLEAWCHVEGGRRFIRQTVEVGDVPTFDLTTP